MKNNRIMILGVGLLLISSVLACMGSASIEPSPTAETTVAQEPDSTSTDLPDDEASTEEPTEEAESDPNAGSVSITIDEDTENLDEIILEIAFGGAGGGDGNPAPNACYEDFSLDVGGPITQTFAEPTWAGWTTTIEYSQNSEVSPNMNGIVWGEWSSCGCGYEPDEVVEFTVDLPNGEGITVSPDNPVLEEYGVRFEIIDVQETEPEINRDNCYSVRMGYYQDVPPVGVYNIKLQQGDTALEDTWVVSWADGPTAFNNDDGVYFLGFQPNEQVDVTVAVSYDAETMEIVGAGSVEDMGWHLVGTVSGTTDQDGKLFVEFDTSQIAGAIVVASADVTGMLYECFGIQFDFHSPCYYDGDVLAALSGEPVPTPAAGAAGDDYDIDTSDCTLDYRFVMDITYPDNTRVSRGETFEKVWLIRNTGTCTWGPEYEIVQIDANNNNLTADQPLYLTGIVEPGDEVEIGVMFTVSDDAPVGGTLYGTVQIQSPDGELFGQKPYVQVVVR